jgi:hypothetical protein
MGRKIGKRVKKLTHIKGPARPRPSGHVAAVHGGGNGK